MLIFKRIEEATKQIKKEITLIGDQGDVNSALGKLRILQKIIVYVNSYEWLSHKNSRKKIRAFLQSQYNYQKVADEFNVTVSSLYVSVSYASKLLEKRIGSKTIELILSNKIEDAEREFLLNTGKYTSEDLFISGVIENFKPFNLDTRIKIDVCEREINFLSSLTKKRFNEIAKQLDGNKIKYLLYILLTSDSNYLAERSTLSGCLNGEIDAKEAIRLIKKDTIYF